MAVLQLLLGQPQFRTTIGVLELDAAQSITHEASSQITKNPIEDGSDVTDNVRLENRTLTIEALISDNPLTLLGSAFNLFTGAAAGAVGELAGGFAAQAAGQALGSIAGIIAGRSEDDVLFPQKAFQYLEELRDRRIPFTVVTKLKRYENMLISRLTVPQSSDVGGSLRFTVTLEQIQVVRTLTIQLPEAQTQTGATPKQDTGKQTGVEDPGSTTLFDLTGTFAGLRSNFGSN